MTDELAVFRPVARAIQDLQLHFVMLRNLNVLPIIAARLHFDLVIVGASSMDSNVLSAMRRLKPLKAPVLGVTQAPEVCEELRAAGASRVVLLSDPTEHLATVMREMLKKAAH